MALILIAEAARQIRQGVRPSSATRTIVAGRRAPASLVGRGSSVQRRPPHVTCNDGSCYLVYPEMSVLIRGFLGVDGTLNNKYRQCEVHVAVGVEYYIHVPQVMPTSDVPKQLFSASMASNTIANSARCSTFIGHQNYCCGTPGAGFTCGMWI